jgi:hypothetical protein
VLVLRSVSGYPLAPTSRAGLAIRGSTTRSSGNDDAGATGGWQYVTGLQPRGDVGWHQHLCCVFFYGTVDRRAMSVSVDGSKGARQVRSALLELSRFFDFFLYHLCSPLLISFG